jgi:PAS domain S-box-containing protein
MIVVIGDDPTCLDALSALLESEGFSVRGVESGSTAIDFIVAHQPELILLDSSMLERGGSEFFRRIRENDATEEIPILFLTDGNEVENRLEGLRKGAVDFISKPFLREELVARVQTHLELSRLRKELDQRVEKETADLRKFSAMLQTELAERDRTEKMLRDREKRLLELTSQTPFHSWVIGPDQKLLFHNRRGLGCYGQPMKQLTGDKWADLVHPDDLARVRCEYALAVEERRGFRIQCRLRNSNRRVRWVLHTGIPRFVDGVFAGHIGATIDITDLQRHHERAIAAQKQESLGYLAAGIAHDFNNLVGSIFAAADLALADLPPDSPARASIDRINAVATRASEIVNLLMAYAGDYAAHTERIDLSLVVAEMVALLRGMASPKTSVKMNLASGLPEIHANVTQIRLIVLNVIMNSLESLQAGEGLVNIMTDKVRVGPARAGTERLEGDYCRLVVADTGCGMTPEVRARAFDPFYSTKFIGRGLGLSVVQGIVRSLSGTVRIDTAPGKGFTCEILLPCAAGRVQTNEEACQAVACGEIPALAASRVPSDITATFWRERTSTDS